MYAVVLTVAFLGFAADRGYQMLMNRMLQWREQTHRPRTGIALDAPAPSLAQRAAVGLRARLLDRSCCSSPGRGSRAAARSRRSCCRRSARCSSASGPTRCPASCSSTPGSRVYRALVGFLISHGARHPDRRGDVAQRHRQLVLRSDRLGRLPDAEDRVPAGGDPVARRLRRVEDHHHRHRRDLPGDRRRPSSPSAASSAS